MAAVIWEIDKVALVIHDHGLAFARMPNPRGMITRLKPLGPLRGRCFERCLQIANSVPDKFWYCEGLADGHPHAWLTPKVLKGEPIVESDWALDPTWLWKSPRYQRGYPMDKVHYYGVRLEGPKVVKWLLAKGKRTGYASCSIFKSVGEWSIEELS